MIRLYEYFSMQKSLAQFDTEAQTTHLSSVCVLHVHAICSPTEPTINLPPMQGNKLFHPDTRGSYRPV